MSADYEMTLAPQGAETADPRLKATFNGVIAKLGFVPNMYARMANLPALLDTYLGGYAAFRAECGFTPAEQEVVFLTISRDNGCTYCVAAHSVIADTASKVPAAVTEAIREGSPIPDARLAALAAFTRTMLASRGRPSRADVDSFLAAGYGERHILGIVLALAVKTLSNYSNHLFHTPLDDVFAKRAWRG